MKLVLLLKISWGHTSVWTIWIKIEIEIEISFALMYLTWKFVNLGEAREEAVEPSMVCPEVETDPLSVNFEYTGSTTPR